jgi:hypothetical protein
MYVVQQFGYHCPFVQVVLSVCLSINFSFKSFHFAKTRLSCKIASALPLGYMWMNGQIHEGCGRMLSATEARILLHSWHVDNPNHLRRGSVGVKKSKRWWGVSAWGASGSSGHAHHQLKGQALLCRQLCRRRSRQRCPPRPAQSGNMLGVVSGAVADGAVPTAPGVGGVASGLLGKVPQAFGGTTSARRWSWLSRQSW